MRLSVALLALCTLACSSGPPPKMAQRPKGCDVTVFRGALPEDVRATRLGEVSSPCGKNDADSDCIRALQDEVCKLGGNVVYEVPDQPEQQSDVMLRYEGVAGHR